MNKISEEQSQTRRFCSHGQHWSPSAKRLTLSFLACLCRCLKLFKQQKNWNIVRQLLCNPAFPSPLLKGFTKIQNKQWRATLCDSHLHLFNVICCLLDLPWSCVVLLKLFTGCGWTLNMVVALALTTNDCCKLGLFMETRYQSWRWIEHIHDVSKVCHAGLTHEGDELHLGRDPENLVCALEETTKLLHYGYIMAYGMAMHGPHMCAWRVAMPCRACVVWVSQRRANVQTSL